MTNYWRNLMCNMLSKRSLNTKDNILYNIIHMKLKNWQN